MLKRYDSFNPPKYARKHGAEVRKEKPWIDPRGEEWTFALLEKCPFNPNHAGARIGLGPHGERTFGCFHNSCKDKKWQQLKELWEGTEKEASIAIQQ